MNELDHKIIAALRQDGRVSIAELAQITGVSRATARSHLNRLIDSGEIMGFGVQLKSAMALPNVRAVMMLEIEGKPSSSIIRQLQGMPEVLALHTTNGRWDYIVEIGSASLSQFDDTIRRIRTLESVSQSETSILLSSHKIAGTSK